MRALRQKEVVKKLTHFHIVIKGWSQDLNPSILASEHMLLPSELKLAQQTAIPDMKEKHGI